MDRKPIAETKVVISQKYNDVIRGRVLSWKKITEYAQICLGES